MSQRLRRARVSKIAGDLMRAVVYWVTGIAIPEPPDRKNAFPRH
jgi:hypothetical protein